MLGIITAVTAERDAILAQLREVKPLKIYDIDFYQGLIGNTQCITTMSGVGKVNAARSTQLMIERFQPSRIVNIGSAGALHPELNIGDVVISTSCIQHDVDLTAFGVKKGSFDDDGDGFILADVDFSRFCQTAMEQSISEQYRIWSGPIATGDQFNDSLERTQQVFHDFGAYCIEMEGAAVAQVCAACRVPFVVIRSISDKPSNQTIESYNQFKHLASQRCVSFLVNLVKVLENQSA